MKIEIVLQATHCNHWPRVKVYNNSNLLCDAECGQEHLTLVHHVEPSSKINKLTIELYNKNFGDNGTWDVDRKNNLELGVQISDIRFDDVGIGHLINDLKMQTHWTPYQLANESPEFIQQYAKFPCRGNMLFNGQIEFEYQMPIYEFLITKKFKQPYTQDIAFYSNYTELFHYEMGLKLVDQIKDTIKRNE
jgi:hypothetical protein